MEVRSSGKIRRKNKENLGGSQSSTRKSIGGNEKVWRQEMRKGRRVQSRGLSAAKYKGPKMADERKKVRKADQMLCGPLQSKGNCLK